MLAHILCPFRAALLLSIQFGSQGGEGPVGWWAGRSRKTKATILIGGLLAIIALALFGMSWFIVLRCLGVFCGTGSQYTTCFFGDCPVRFAPYIPVVKISNARPKHLLLWKNRTLNFCAPTPQEPRMDMKNRHIWSQDRDVT